jgi:glycosyltransferase involved in cell wall biosynthesis
MRIAINTRFLLPGRMEGIGRFSWEISRELVRRHPEHQFLFFFDRPFNPRFIPADNVQPVVLFPPARHPLLWYAWFQWAIPHALHKYRADCFFSPDGFTSLRTKLPNTIVTHDLAHLHFPEAIPPLVRQYYQYFVPKFLQHASSIVTVSSFTATDIQQQYHIHPNKIFVAGNGCDPAFKPLNISEQQLVRDKYTQGQPYFFYLGAMHPRKNIERLIAAFDRFKAQSGAPHKLLLAGRLAWQTGSIRQALAAAQHHRDIIMPGYVSDDELPRLMGAAFALTFVSLFEGFGVPLIEAMQCHTPILCANTSSLPEVAGNAAITVNPYSIPDIAHGMLLLLNQQSLRQSIVSHGLIQKDKFSWGNATTVVGKALGLSS